MQPGAETSASAIGDRSTARLLRWLAATAKAAIAHEGDAREISGENA